MKLRLACPVMKDSIVDGPGLRTVIWTQGCLHQCLGCHNPQTHDAMGGIEIEQGAILAELEELRMQRGITLSGGEPFLQAKALIAITQKAKVLNLDVWSYTGFTWEQLMDKERLDYEFTSELLRYIDVIVDGRYIQSLRAPHLKFRGSANQRVIDVQQSLVHGKAVLAEGY